MKKKPELIVVPEDHSFRINSETELFEAFADKDKRIVLMPQGVSYPVDAKHYLAWREPSGNYTYMIFKKPRWSKPMGLVFKRPTSVLEAGARHCDWCLTYGTANEVGLLGLKLNARQSIGIMLCADLACANRLETVAELTGKSFDKLSGQLYDRIGKLFESVIRARSRGEDPSVEDAP